MVLNALVDSFCHNQKTCGTERVNGRSLLDTSVGTRADPYLLAVYVGDLVSK